MVICSHSAAKRVVRVPRARMRRTTPIASSVSIASITAAAGSPEAFASSAADAPPRVRRTSSKSPPRTGSPSTAIAAASSTSISPGALLTEGVAGIGSYDTDDLRAGSVVQSLAGRRARHLIASSDCVI
jgi:hypothetical protein